VANERGLKPAKSVAAAIVLLLLLPFIVKAVKRHATKND